MEPFSFSVLKVGSQSTVAHNLDESGEPGQSAPVAAALSALPADWGLFFVMCARITLN